MKRFIPPFKFPQNSQNSQKWSQRWNVLSNDGIGSGIGFKFGNNSQMSSSFTQSRVECPIKSESTQRRIEAEVPTEVRALDGTPLRAVTALPAKYQTVFVNRFPYFNCIQSQVFNDVIYSDKSIAVCSPTGSGKTVIFEMAIIRELMNFDSNGCPLSALKVVYMAPLKKLVDEKYSEFVQSFSRFGLNCLQLTGDSDIEDYERLRDVNIVLTTPEKWDSMIRNNENSSLIQTIQLMLIDEIHTINDENRGATIEAVISRMKTLRSVQLKTSPNSRLRFIAASATAPNVEDIAYWLDPNNSKGYTLADSLRPVRLQKIVLGYQCRPDWTDFRFDIQLSYKLCALIKSYSESKPTLIFCSTRKSVHMTAQTLAKTSIGFFNTTTDKMFLMNKTSGLKNNELKTCLQKGIGFHHSGIDRKDREIVESLFVQSKIPVLISTTTLSMGVNLPAHLVIIKNTSQYTPNGSHEYPETQILQMIGRAGRPQFDSSAVAVIMTKEKNKGKYENLLNGTQVIESNLHKNLVEQLNAEISLRTVTSFEIAVNWIRSTFLFIRVLKNPVYYGSTVQISNIEQSLQLVENWCRKELTGLRESDMISTDPEFSQIIPTQLGRFMARHCVSHKTMKKFCQMCEQELSLKEIIEEMAKIDEIRSDCQLRVNEKKILNELNQNPNEMTIRYTISGKIKTADMKINCLIQSTFGSLQIHDTTLIQESLRIMRTGQRLSRCLSDVLYFKVKQNTHKINFRTLLNALILNKCFKAKLWHDSTQVAKQLNRIGNQLSKALVERGLKSFNDIKKADPRDIEFCLKRHPPFGRQLIDEVKHLPYYLMRIEQNMNDGLRRSDAKIKIIIRLENIEDVRERQILVKTHSTYLVVGNEENELFYCNRVYDSSLIRNNGLFETKEMVINRNGRSKYISAHLISDSFVGLDVECRLRPLFADDSHRAPDPTQNETNCSINCSIGFSDRSAINTITETPTAPTARSEGCQHKCVNKANCLHVCCKKGLISDEIPKQVTKNKRQLNSEQNAPKKSKQNKTEEKRPQNNLDNWLKSYIKKNPKPNTTPQQNPKTETESHYFKNNRFAEISDNEANDDPIKTDMIFDDLDFDNDLDFEDSFDDITDEQIDKILENKPFDDGLEAMLACNEDFQEFDIKTENSMENMAQKTVKSEPNSTQSMSGSMSQWSHYLPASQADGKSVFTYDFDL